MADFDKAINYRTDVIMNYNRNEVDDLDYINLKEKIIKENLNQNNQYNKYEENTRVYNPLFSPNTFINQQTNYSEINKIDKKEFDPYLNFLNNRGLNGNNIKVRYNVEYINIDSVNRNIIPYNITPNIYKLNINPLSIINDKLNIKIDSNIINTLNVGDNFSLTNIKNISASYLAYGDTNYNNQVYDNNGVMIQQPLLIQFFKDKDYAQISVNPNFSYVLSTNPLDAVNFSVLYKYFDTSKSSVLISGFRGVREQTYFDNKSTFITYIDSVNQQYNTNIKTTIIKNDTKYPYIGNIPISFINQTHQIYFVPPSEPTIVPSISKFYIQLPWASDGTNIYSSSDAENYNISLTFNHYNLIPLNELNADYPINSEHINGYHIIDSIDMTSNIITCKIYLPINSLYVNLNNFKYIDFGGDNIYFAPVTKIAYGYPNQNNYIINLNKVFNNVIQLKLIDSLFVNPSITFINYGDGKNNRLYFQNIENIEEIQYIEIPEGTYDTISLKNSIEYQFSQLQRKINPINFGYDLNYNVIFSIDISTNITTITSYKSKTLQIPITNVNPVINQNDLSVGVGTFTITILHENHGISYGNPNVIFDGFIDHLGIPASSLNGIKNITIIDTNRYSFVINNVNLSSTKIITNGGNNVKVLVPSPLKLYFNYSDTMGSVLGYRNPGYETSITEYSYIQKNTDIYYGEINKDVNGNEIILKNNAIKFKKYEYFLMNCNLTNINNLSNAQKKEIFFAKFKINDNTTITDSFSQTPIYFYNPIMQLNQIGFSFYNPDNTLVDFKDRDHSFVLEITTLDNLPELTSINPNISLKT
jgi:hypothetical protein